ncbi:kinetochore complex Sim4 subunit Fta1-domain-containing protein [Microdochium trichocladiopsis]|uniref:Kinetochore complex Sim4 subunit Fta1-domain-containing protein n=1 Tax=Microdochium trichocladiopsis TaxID=1682393 RepID=A0A9P8YCH0_9PEZI|nr:kinetochore complex Sim4 subunit Fta1-domain-containing protein [Microdochium trichocladiopsis]KAH7035948.1 kinetochore complex Sim4 subunit Fta1-domain-containing protein [Microdochium trichocladiopsis]
MPPRKRRAAPTQPEPEQEASPQASDGSDQEDDFGPDGAPRKSMPFFNVTYTTHRASPLHVGSEPLSAARLQTLSRRLRDTLVGDVVRGVQVGLAGGDDGSLGRAGILESVEWRWVKWGDLIGSPDDDDDDDDEHGHAREGSLDLGAGGSGTSGRASRKSRKALCLELKYENAYFTASLLPSIYTDQSPRALAWDTTGTAAHDATTTSKAFVHLPLLLLRMPAPLRSVVSDFLAGTFDCRISSLHLGTRSLVHMWESWLTTSRIGKGGAKVTKDVVLTLGFHLEQPDDITARTTDPSATDSIDAMHIDAKDTTSQQPPPQGLKSIDIILPAPHVARFLRAGRRIQRSNVQAHGLAATGKRKRGAKPAPSVFSHNTGGTDPTTTSAEHQDRLARLRRKLAGGKSEEGWSWRSAQQTTRKDDDDDEDNDTPTDQPKSQQQQQQPFTEAVAAYLSTHLALDMFHPAVRIIKIACGGFVAAESGRLKVFEPLSSSPSSSLGGRAAERLVADLARKAASGGGGSVVGADGTTTEGGKDGQGQQQGPWSQAALRIAELAAAATSTGNVT